MIIIIGFDADRSTNIIAKLIDACVAYALLKRATQRKDYRFTPLAPEAQWAEVSDESSGASVPDELGDGLAWVPLQQEKRNAHLVQPGFQLLQPPNHESELAGTSIQVCRHLRQTNFTY